MRRYQNIIDPILERYPETQAVYLFGTYDTNWESQESDLDIAVLLPPDRARQMNFRERFEIADEISSVAKKEKVDLINLRLVDTVFQKEIIFTGRRIYCADEYAGDEFEMLTLSLYQKLNEERKDIIAEGIKSGRFYDV